jgi:hypothetical protein
VSLLDYAHTSYWDSIGYLVIHAFNEDKMTTDETRAAFEKDRLAQGYLFIPEYRDDDYLCGMTSEAYVNWLRGYQAATAAAEERIILLQSLLREASEHTAGCHDCICLTGGDLQARIDAALAAPLLGGE